MPIDTTIARGHGQMGHYRVLPLEHTGPTSYATGGEAFDHGSPLPLVPEVVPSFLAWSGTAVRLVVWDPTNKKLVWYVPNTGAEVAATTDLSSFKGRLTVVGK